LVHHLASRVSTRFGELSQPKRFTEKMKRSHRRMNLLTRGFRLPGKALDVWAAHVLKRPDGYENEHLP
tara:strand:- start:2898 stop:3101 length:204 start_codon:yes stop_codon:yes gene_type:complete